MERAVLRPSYHPFQRRIGRMRDFFPKLPAPLSQIRKTKGLAGNKSKVGGYVSEELSLRGREESRRLSSGLSNKVPYCPPFIHFWRWARRLRPRILERVESRRWSGSTE